MSTFQRIGIAGKPISDNRSRKLVADIRAWLDNNELQYLLDQTLIHAGCSEDVTVDRNTLVAQSDLIIVVGGDGTLLDAARSVAGHSIALLGVNIGRLGFLVDVSPDELHQQLDSIFSGAYYEEQRAMLNGTIYRNGKAMVSANALNDIVLRSHDSVRMIEFETRIDEQRVNTQRADGIVVATPTGSTAYALSGGGPILHPGLSALTLVPICPHTLSSRPIVVTGDSQISVRLLDRSHSNAQVAFDAQQNVAIKIDDEVRISVLPQPLRLIHPKEYDYYHILRKKLRWSEQP